MKRSSLCALIALAGLAACSYYDTSLLKFSPETGEDGGRGGALGGAGATGSGPAGGNAAGGLAGTAGAGGAANAGTGGGAGTSGGGAAGNGGAGGASTAGAPGAGGVPQAGAGGSSGGGGSPPTVCVRAVIPGRPVLSAAGAGGSLSSGAGGGSAAAAGGSGGGGSSGGPGGSSGAGTGGKAGGAGSKPGPQTVDNLVFALRSSQFGEMDDPSKSTVGFDLDGSCTCDDAPGEICKPTKPRSPLCDGPGGRDNSFPRLLKELVSFGLANSSAATSKSIEEGRYNVLLRVRGWNGEPDDPDVSLGFFVSRGTSKLPEWDGKDVWSVGASSVTDGDLEKPTLLDTSAYVTGGQLVGSLPTFDANDKKIFIQLSESFGISLSGAVVVAKLESFLGAYRISEGTLSGRWRDRDFFSQISGYKIKTSPDPVCTDNFLYPQIKDTFCKYADLPGNVSDVTGSCSAMSLAMRFTAQQAVLGQVVTLPPPVMNNCGPDKNPANDSCSK